MTRIILLFVVAAAVNAENGYDAWLRYARLPDPALREVRRDVPAPLVVLGHSPVLESARDELIRGLRGMAGRTLRIESAVPSENAIVIGALAARV